MSDAYGPSSGAILRRAVLLTAGCGAAAFLVPRWMAAGDAVTQSARAPAQPLPAPQRPVARPPAAAASDEDSATIFDNNELTFHAGRNNQFFVRASINGIEIPFIVDTGAFRIALRPEDAELIGFNLGSLHWDVPVSTANGNAFAASVTLASVRLDRVTEYNVPATVMQQHSASPSLLGMSFLSRLKSWRIHDGVLTIRY
ncbi:MAG TPA: TIGR02281 family clan AA aspartic protease [Stellaceae bacterium]|jgi:clan AA aspartic protease (TIGR02281 family)|nr:TIGR02281 family clan AA aspartic protease [Stellaceae bacterium]